MAPDIPEGSLAGPERYSRGGLHSTPKGHLDGLQGKHRQGWEERDVTQGGCHGVKPGDGQHDY